MTINHSPTKKKLFQPISFTKKKKKQDSDLVETDLCHPLHVAQCDFVRAQDLRETRQKVERRGLASLAEGVVPKRFICLCLFGMFNGSSVFLLVFVGLYLMCFQCAFLFDGVS